MPESLPGVLVLCTGNSARSILGEAILAVRGAGRLRAYSAGSKPKGVPHPAALRLLTRKGIATEGFRSKSWNEFTGPDAPPIDLAITVCGNADQVCPMYPGQLNRHHWPFDDPAHATGSEEEIMTVFRRVRDEIKAVFTAYADGRRDQMKHQPTV